MFARNTNNMKKPKKLWLKLTAGILTMAGTVTALAACNNNSTQQPNIPAPTPSEQTISVSLIYDGIGVSMDTKAMLQTEVNQIAENVYGDADVKAYGLKDDDLQVISMVGDELSSVVVSLPQETIDYLKGDVKDSVLSKAGLTPQQEVKESEKSQIVEKISNAVDYIESKIGAISDLPVGNVNYYVSGETQENVNSETVFSVLGPILQDVSFIRYDVQTDGDLLETPIIIAGASDKTAEEIYEEYRKGNYRTGISNQIDLSSPYTAPTPIDPENPGEVEDEISFEEIYNQVFGEGFMVADAQSLLNDLAERVFSSSKNVKLIAVDINDVFKIYAEGVDAIGRTALVKGEYTGNDLETIKSTLLLLQEIDNAGGWGNYINSFAPSEPIEEGSTSHTQLIETLQSIKEDIKAVDTISSLTRSDFSAKNIINATREELPASSNAFGEALLGNMGEKGTIIATYVGDMSGEILDSAHRFDTGYYTEYNITVVYEKNNQIVISSKTVYNAWYNNSTNESLYRNLLNGNDDFLLVGGNTITIDNPLLLNEKKVEELSISL